MMDAVLCLSVLREESMSKKLPTDTYFRGVARQGRNGVYFTTEMVEMANEDFGELAEIDPPPLLYFSPTRMWWYRREIYTGDIAMQNCLYQDAPPGTIVVMVDGVWYYAKREKNKK